MLEKKINVHTFCLLFALSCGLNLVLNSTQVKAKSKSETRPIVIPDYGGFMRNVAIGNVGNVQLTANIAIPLEKQSKPSVAIIFLHSGGFVSGTKDKYNNRISKYAQKLNVVAVSSGYRLSPEYGFPAAIEDVKANIRFLKAHAKDLNIDPNKIIVAGSSAGGYLAAMAAVTGNDSSFSKNGLYTEFDSKIQFAMIQSGIIGDFFKPHENAPSPSSKKLSDDIMKRLFRNIDISKEAANKRFSPLSYLDENDPPMLIAHGDTDSRIPVQMTRDFVRQLEQLNIEHDYYEIKGGTHSLSRSKPIEARKVRDKLISRIKDLEN